MLVLRVFGVLLLLPACAAAQSLPLPPLLLSTDTALDFDVSVIDDDDVFQLDGSAPVLRWIGILPGVVDVGSFTEAPGGERLFSMKATATLGFIAYGPADVVRFDGTDYAIEFSGATAGVPAGAVIDAVTLSGQDLVVSFDTSVMLGTVSIADEDLVRVTGAGSPSLFLDSSLAGIASTLDLDAAQVLPDGSILVSFDSSGTVGAHKFDDEDVLSYDPASGQWQLYADLSAQHASWVAADLDALAAPAEDPDLDGVSNPTDNCPLVANADQSETDADGAGDVCDNCVLAPNGPVVPDAGGLVQNDADGDGIGNVCDPDFNNDCVVNFADLSAMKAVFFRPDPEADLNGDGIVNFADLSIMKELFFAAPGPSGTTGFCATG